MRSQKLVKLSSFVTLTDGQMRSLCREYGLRPGRPYAVAQSGDSVRVLSSDDLSDFYYTMGADGSESDFIRVTP